MARRDYWADRINTRLSGRERDVAHELLAQSKSENFAKSNGGKLTAFDKLRWIVSDTNNGQLKKGSAGGPRIGGGSGGSGLGGAAAGDPGTGMSDATDAADDAIVEYMNDIFQGQWDYDDVLDDLLSHWD